MDPTSVAASYDAVTKSRAADDDTAATVFPYRHYNNFIKRTLILDVVDYYTSHGLRHAPPVAPGPREAGPSQLAVMDIASGRGGDIKKWAFHGRIGRYAGQMPVVGYVHGFDISPGSVEEANHRYSELLKKCSGPIAKFQFEVADAFSPSFWESLHQRQHLSAAAEERIPVFDVVSCFFALHYACRSRDALGSTLSGISRALKEGGVFFGTIVDADELARYLIAGGEQCHNDLYQLKLPGGCDVPIESLLFRDTSHRSVALGVNYLFYLDGHVDSDEFTVPFDELVQIASLYGLSLVHKYSFPFTARLSHWHGDKSKISLFTNAGDLSRDELALVRLYRTFCFEKTSSAAATLLEHH